MRLAVGDTNDLDLWMRGFQVFPKGVSMMVCRGQWGKESALTPIKSRGSHIGSEICRPAGIAGERLFNTPAKFKQERYAVSPAQDLLTAKPLYACIYP